MLARQVAHVAHLADQVLQASVARGVAGYRSAALKVGQSIQAVGGDIAYRTAPAAAQRADRNQLSFPGTETPLPPAPGEGRDRDPAGD